MRFADIRGNESVKRALVNMADSGRVAHAVMMYENDGGGAFPMAIAYLQYLHCQHRRGGDSCGECPSCHKISKLIHPDVHFVFPVNSGSKCSAASKDIVSDNYMSFFRELAVSNPYFMESDLSAAIGIEGKAGSISVKEARCITETLSLSPLEDGWKVIVCYLPEKMNVAAANKLLKSIEEPPVKSLFLFITHNPDKVIQTITSRCQASRILPLPKDEIARTLENVFDVDAASAAVGASSAGGSVGAALKACRNNEDFQTFLEIYSALITAVISRDLTSALDCADRIAALGSREKQKAFCNFAGECLRKSFLYRQGLQGIANVLPQEQSIVEQSAGALPGAYYGKALRNLDSAAAMVDRNVNQKIIFCDLVDRFFINM